MDRKLEGKRRERVEKAMDKDKLENGRVKKRMRKDGKDITGEERVQK